VAMLKTVLVHVPERAFPCMTRDAPLKAADFFTACFQRTDLLDAGAGISADDAAAIPLLALSGLFTLISEHNLDYPLFYHRLYSVLRPPLFHTPPAQCGRFLELVEVFLNSAMMPAYLAAAFAKRFARCALVAPPGAAIYICALTHGLLRRHAECKQMIHRTEPRGPTDVAAAKEADLYDMDEPDPEKCRALDSSLWELASLRRHYCPEVSRLADIFGQKIDAQSKALPTQEFSGFTFDSLLGEHMKKKKGRAADQDVPLAFTRFTSLFQPGDAFDGLLGQEE